ncbi:MAG: hypothetical protein GY854_24980 [Deltaproteobacteria bacterium]|nr:hypothetical protein [Deltaproteobacteria bacterium]
MLQASKLEYLEKALSKKPEDRFSSAAELLEALSPYQDQVEDLMSTTSIRALNSSLMPPPYQLSENRDSLAPVCEKSSGSFDETIDSNILEVTDSTALKPRKSKRQAVIIAAVLAIIAVTISIRGVQPRAEMLLNRKKVESPFETPRSDKPMLLEVTAPGYNTFQKLLVPNEDQTVELSMQRKPRHKARRKKHPKQNETVEKPSDDWQPNPFNK